MQVWVGTLRISLRVAEKIVREHGITPLQVRHAVERVPGLVGTWDYSEGRLRVIIQTVIGDDNALVVLYPADDLGPNIWRLASAYPVR